MSQALAAHTATVAEVDLHVRRILRTMFAFGLFDRAPYTNVDGRIDHRAHERDARQVEASAITLLRNSGGILPLRARGLRRVAIIGANATRFVTGGGSGNITPYHFVSPLTSLTRRLGRHVSVTYDVGTDRAKAVRDARAASVAIVFAGDYDTEGADRHCLTLECPPFEGDQDGLIRAVAAAQHRTVVVLETGGPVLTPWRHRIAGLLEAWYPGGQAGPAITSVLFGDTDPSGRLQTTFPANAAQLPTSGNPQRYPGVNERVTYSEGLLVGYRWYDAKRLAPPFPFGYGLSYTTFSLGQAKVRRLGAARFSISVPVRNTGTRDGAEVVQLYVGDPTVTGEPPRQLKAFAKIDVKPGHTRTVTLQLDSTSFAHYSSAAHAWRVTAGRYHLYVGTSSRDLPDRPDVSVGKAP